MSIDKEKKEETSIENIYKKIDSTSKTRFHASRRLRNHSKRSTLMVVLISLGLIFISLMQSYSLGNNINNELVGLIQIFSAVAILVYSLLISKNDYSNLSEKMYSCASQLGYLKQKVHPYLIKEHNQEVYEGFLKEYHRILELYETHSNYDFRADYASAQIEMENNYPKKWGESKDSKLNEWRKWLSAHYKVRRSYFCDVWSYILMIVIIFGVVYWVSFGTVANNY